jgi:serine/threonine protein phosphatase PrpC
MQDHPTHPWTQGATLAPGGTPRWCLLAPVVGSARWLAQALDGPEQAELLWVPPGGKVGPWGPHDPELDACGRGCERVPYEGGVALVFPQDEGWLPLADLLSPRYAPPDEPERARRWALALALLELFEVLHELGAAWALRGPWEALAVRPTSEGGWLALWRWPEHLSPAGAPQAHGWGGELDAPEVAGGQGCAASDVFLLGGLVASVLAGARLDAKALGPGGWAWSLRLFDPDLPLGVEAPLRRALRPSPSARFESVGAFAAALRAAWAWGLARGLPWEGALGLAWGAASDIGEGKRRKQFVNQDEHLGLWDPDARWGLFAVMDGVSRCDIGGGDLASWAARQALSEGFHRKRLSAIYGATLEPDAPFPRRWLEALCHKAHAQVAGWSKLLAHASGASEGSVACTTLTALGVFGASAVVGGVGDSPAYVCAQGADGAWFLERVFVGHPAWAEAWRAGAALSDALTEGEGLGSALGVCCWEGDPPGPEPLTLEVELRALPLRPREAWLLASDGISDSLGREAQDVIVGVLAEALARMDAPWAARRLVEEANRRGGPDNLTALVVLTAPPQEAA